MHKKCLIKEPVGTVCDAYTKTVRRTTLLVFFFLLSLYTATGRYFIDNSDGETMYLVTRSISQGRLWIEPEMTTTLNLTEGKGGHQYGYQGVFMSIAALPFYYIGLFVVKIFPALPEGLVLRASFLFGPMLYTSATAALLLFFIVQLGFGLRRSVFVALAYGLATLAFPYAKYPFSEPLSALLQLGAVWFAWQVWRNGSSKAAAWMGLLLGLAFLTRHANIVAVPFFFIFLFFAIRRFNKDFSHFIKPVTSAGATFAIGAGLWALYNYLRFGDPLSAGEQSTMWLGWDNTPLFHAAQFLLFSPAKGIFWYAPIMIMATLGFPYLYRRHPQLSLLIISVIVFHWLIYSYWPFYTGDWCWGPRFLVDIIPLWIMPLAALPFSRSQRSRTLDKTDEEFVSESKTSTNGQQSRRTPFFFATMILAGVSFAIQLLAVNIFYMRYLHVINDTYGSLNRYYEEPRLTPLLGALQTAGELRWDRLDQSILTHGSGQPEDDFKTEMRTTLDLWPVYIWRLGLPPALIVIWLLQLAAAIIFARALWRQLRNHANSKPCKSGGTNS